VLTIYVILHILKGRNSICFQERYVKKQKETPEDVHKWFMKEAKKLWPLAKGSLTERRNKCIYPDCRACQSGEKHLSHVLYLKKNGRNTSVHVPKDMVKIVKTATINGKRLENLLSEAGERFLKALKNEKKEG